MKRHSFTRPPASGWLEPLPASAKAEISRRWPIVPVEQVERMFSTYLLLREAQMDTPSASAIKAELETFAKNLEATCSAAEALSNTNIGSLMRQVGGLRGHPDALGKLVEALRVVRLLMPHVLDQMPYGHADGAKAQLVRNIASLVQKAGLPVNAKPTGPTVGIIDILLDAAGENLRDVRKLVARELDNQP